MWVAKLPQPGDEIRVIFSGTDRGVATVISVRPYTGRFTQLFTHVMRYTALNTRRGWMEIPLEVAGARDDKR